MRIRVFFCVFSCLMFAVTAASAQTPYHAWSQGFGDSDLDRSRAMAIDGYGNLYVTGHFLGDIDLGGGLLSSAGSYDVYVAKYATDGSHLWSQRFGSVGSDYATDVSVDRFGFVSIVGRFGSTIDFGGSVLNSLGDNDIFAAKFNPDGVHIWSASVGSVDHENGTCVALDASGNTIIAGYFPGSLTINSLTHSSNGLNDIILVKFNELGSVVWSQSFGGTGDDWAEAVATDSQNDILLAADSYSSIDFGGGAHARIAGLDVYLVKFESGGAYNWSYIRGGGSSDYVRGLTVDSDDNILMTGYFYGNADFGGGPIFSSGNNDAYLVKYTFAGAHVWSDAFGGPGADQGYRVATDSDNNVYLAGSFAGTASFGGDPLTSLGERDMVLARYTTNGGHVWSQSFGGTGNDEATGVAADGFGSVAVFGEFKNAMDMGGGPLYSSGNYDIVLAKFYHGPEIHSVLDIPGDQGGIVNVAWDACTADNATDRVITEYTLWRAIDAAAAASFDDGTVRQIDDLSEIISARTDQPLVRAEGAYYWYLVGTIDALAFDNYSAPTPTLFDSTGVSSAYHYFQVVAHTIDPYVYYSSAPDSGYSVDNLAPAAPQNLIAVQTITPNGLELTWNANSEADLSHYAVFRGIEPGFVADSGSLLGESADTTTFDDGWHWSSDYWYKVFAVDIHGNLSPYALLGPDLVTGADGPSVTSARLDQNIPNPFNPVTTITYSVKERGHVALEIYDVAGRLVRTLVDDVQAPSAMRQVVWNGTDNAGNAVSSGVYFYRLAMNDFSQTRKMVLLK